MENLNLPNEDLLSYFLPEELVLYILQFLEMNDLGRCASVNSNWKRLAVKDDDSLWMIICKQRWEGKQSEEQLLNGYKYQDDDSHKSPNRKTWKQLYFEAEEDSRRTKITLEEVCTIKWEFVFHGVPNYAQHPVFNYDYTLRMNPRLMKWRFVEEEGETYIQVDQYPYLAISRTEDWGWQLTNNYVRFNSVGKNPEASKKQKRDTASRWWFLLPLQLAVLNDADIEIDADDEVIEALLNDSQEEPENQNEN